MESETTVIERIHRFNKFGVVLGLERMRELLRRLGNPHETLKVIHVAGTNGKGSTVKFLECGLAACGYKVGLYTSPYLERFEERIRFDGEDIDAKELELCGERVIRQAEAMVADGLDSPTEFEVVTAIAFLYFKEKQADITILETGLGGIGDSTNVVDSPLICAITSISYDHMDRLGNTLTEIAGNKAGIIKSGCPLVSNVAEREPARVIARTAYEKGSRLYDISGITAATTDDTPLSQTVSMEIYEKDYSDIEIPMVGAHQAENLKTALCVLEVLRRTGKISLDKEKLREGLRGAKQPGRFEIIKAGRAISENVGGDGEPTIIIDGAHNENGAAALLDTMKRYFSGARVLVVVGILADKETDSILRNLVEITEHFIATEPDNPRKLAAEELAEHLGSFGAETMLAHGAEESIELAGNVWNEYDVVLFTGSLYLIGDIRRLLRNEQG